MNLPEEVKKSKDVRAVVKRFLFLHAGKVVGKGCDNFDVCILWFESWADAIVGTYSKSSREYRLAWKEYYRLHFLFTQALHRAIIRMYQKTM